MNMFRISQQAYQCLPNSFYSRALELISSLSQLLQVHRRKLLPHKQREEIHNCQSDHVSR